MERRRRFAVSERVREHRRIRDALDKARKTVVGGVILVLWGASQGLKLDPPWCWACMAVATALGAGVSIHGLRAAGRAGRALARHRRGWSAGPEERAPTGAFPR